MTVQTFIITTVPNPIGAGAIYQVSGQNKPILNLVRGGVYTFNQSAASNTNHPIAFKDGAGAAYTVGVTSTGVAGQPGAQTVLVVSAVAPNNLRYYCVTHGNNMGNSIIVTGIVAAAIQPINIGNQVNDGLGDDLRTAFQKVNANFTELNAQLTITASNIGSTGAGIFKEKIGADLQFKKLKGSSNISVTDLGDVIEFRDLTPTPFFKFTTDTGVIQAGTNNSNGHIALIGMPALQSVFHPGSVSGLKDIQITTNGSDQVFFRTLIPVTDILLSFDFGPITGSYTNAIQLSMAQANIDFGLITLPGRFNLDFGALA